MEGTVMRKILIMGLPGAGKTTLAQALAPLLNAVTFNADGVRANLSRDLGFSHEDRIEHARRIVRPRGRGGGHHDSRFCLPHGGDARCVWRRLHYLDGSYQRGPI
jgi:hypothetical protein